MKKIKGIGPKFEGDLNAKGVYYFRQIAAWTPADVKMVDEIIDSFPGRIERDEWVKQAKELAKGLKLMLQVSRFRRGTLHLLQVMPN